MRLPTLLLVATLTVCCLVAGCASDPEREAHAAITDYRPADGHEALEMLIEGNTRFREGRPWHDHETIQRRLKLATEQHPFAIVLGCADSRVPPELIFDHGIGDLFVIRVAGNVVAEHRPHRHGRILRGGKPRLPRDSRGKKHCRRNESSIHDCLHLSCGTFTADGAYLEITSLKVRLFSQIALPPRRPSSPCG